MRALATSPTYSQPMIVGSNTFVSQDRARRIVRLSGRALFEKLHQMGEAGSGKSRFLGRVLCWLRFRYCHPQVILDPTGGTIDNFFDKLIRLPRERQEQLWPRVRYVDMSGKGGYVVPFPLYHPLSPNDSLFDVSQRFLEVVRRMDVHLDKAPILGLNALATISTYTGMLLTALGYQITEAESLIRRPEEWEGRLERALSITPEVQPAVEFFRDYIKNPKERARQSNTFLTKIMPFIAEPTMRAMFGASEPGIDWDEAVKKGYTVCLDFSKELNAERRRFKLLWCFRSLTDYFKLRGAAGRKQPVGFVIDEVTQLLGFGAGEQSVMAEDIEELVSVVARNYGVAPLCIAHQNLPQLNSERIQKALMTMGTQMIGVQSDPESALLLAQYFHRYDPYLVKRYEPVWMSDMFGPFVVDHRPVDFTLEEQATLNSYGFMNLGRFQFIVRPAVGEGDKQGQLRRVSIARFDPGIYPNAEWGTHARQLLMQRDGRPVEEVLGAIDSRRRIEMALRIDGQQNLKRLSSLRDDGRSKDSCAGILDLDASPRDKTPEKGPHWTH